MKDLFSKISPLYSRYRPTYPPVLFRSLASLTEKHDLAWDVATGTGQSADKLADFYNHVTATDGSTSQLAHAKPRSNVEYKHLAIADPDNLLNQPNFPLRPNTVDLVTVSQALHWFHDLPAFHRLVRKILVPGGVYAAIGYDIPPNSHSAFDEALWEIYEHVLGPYWEPERQLITDRYKGMNFDGFDEISLPLEVQEQIEKLDVHWSFNDVWGYIQSWSACQRAKEVNGRDILEEYKEKLAKTWDRPLDEPKILHFPLFIRVFRNPI